MKSSKRKLKLTGWYPKDSRPLKSRPGWYKADYNGSTYSIYWDGVWSTAPGGHVFWYQDCYWRGVSR